MAASWNIHSKEYRYEKVEKNYKWYRTATSKFMRHANEARKVSY